MQQRARDGKRRRVTAFGQFGQQRPAGIGQAQQFGRFVEGFASGVIDGVAEKCLLTDTIDLHQLGVPAGDQQRDERERGRRIGQQR